MGKGRDGGRQHPSGSSAPQRAEAAAAAAAPTAATAAPAPGARPSLDLRDLAVGAAAALIAREVFSDGETGLSYDALKNDLRAAARKDPLDAVLGTVALGTYLFYRAEKGHNPRVETLWDALAFITTCLSVGYDDVFARTDAGKAVASAVMTFGPALSSAALDPPAPARPPEDPDELSRAILARLDKLVELSSRPTPAGT